MIDIVDLFQKRLGISLFIEIYFKKGVQDPQRGLLDRPRSTV